MKNLLIIMFLSLTLFGCEKETLNPLLGSWGMTNICIIDGEEETCNENPPESLLRITDAFFIQSGVNHDYTVEGGVITLLDAPVYIHFHYTIEGNVLNLTKWYAENSYAYMIIETYRRL